MSGERVVPSEYGKAEAWVIPPGGIIPVWMFVLLLVLVVPRFLSNPIPLRKYTYGYLTNNPYTPTDYSSSNRRSVNSDRSSHEKSDHIGVAVAS